MKYLFSLAVAMFLLGCGNDATKQHTQETTQAHKEATTQQVPKTETKKEVVTAEEMLPKEPKMDTFNPEIIYTKCASCHGPNGETKALGKSDIIANWSKTKLATALKEYKAGTRNIHGMGAIMKGQVAKLTDEQIDQLAAYIANLKK